VITVCAVLRISPAGERAARNAVMAIIAIEIFADPVAQRAGIVAEQFIKQATSFDTQRLLIARELFRDDARTLRYGIGENLYGYDAITAFSSGALAGGADAQDRADGDHKLWPRHRGSLDAVLSRLRSGQSGRQMQTWVRFAGGWKIVAAHVSIIDEPGSSKDMDQKA